MEELAGQAAQEARAIRLEGAQFLPSAAARADSRHQAVGIPISVNEDLKGVLLLMDKRSDDGRFTPVDLDILESLAVQSAISLQNAEFHEIQINYFTHTIELLVMSLEGSVVPRNHLHNVARYAGMIARQLKIDDGLRRNIHFAALLHDIGMIKVPPDRQAVKDHYEAHPLLGSEMVGRITLWQDLVPIIRHHHENYDGSGYPQKLTGPDIPLSARIIAIAESFDAMTNPHSYRTVLDRDGALTELQINSGSRYDPKLVDLFCRVISSHDEH